jgi:hypothetical protein
MQVPNSKQKPIVTFHPVINDHRDLCCLTLLCKEISEICTILSDEYMLRVDKTNGMLECTPRLWVGDWEYAKRY